MKLQKTFFILIILFASLQICFGQENPKAQLFDELVNSFCSEDIKLRLDVFANELYKEPNSKAYIVGYADFSIEGRFQTYQDAIKKIIAFRKFDAKRFIFLREENQDKMTFQLWIVPNGAVPPKLEGRI